MVTKIQMVTLDLCAWTYAQRDEFTNVFPRRRMDLMSPQDGKG